jgi:anti-repressor protein
MHLRVLQKDGEPWFVAADVAKVLEFRDPHNATRGLDPEEISLLTIRGLNRGKPAIIISESGLYLLVLKSRKPEAKAFQKWGTGEVLEGQYR